MHFSTKNADSKCDLTAEEYESMSISMLKHAAFTTIFPGYGRLESNFSQSLCDRISLKKTL